MTDVDRQLFDYLLTFLTADRQTRFADVLSKRTRRITVVLEDFYGTHNIGAVLRTCDAFGVQDVHVIEDEHEFEHIPKIALGSHKWLTIHRHGTPNPRVRCATALREAGYRLLAVTPHADAQPPEDVDLGQPCALIFGTEKEGLTDEIQSLADGAVKIPMCGFVESLNVSVAAALCIYPLMRRLHNGPPGWGLSDDERETLLYDWVRKSLPHVAALEQRFWESRAERPLATSPQRAASGR